MSFTAPSVTALKQTSFQFFAESVWAHSSSTQFCLHSVPRCRAAHSERATTKNSSFPLTVQGATDRGTQVSSPGQWWYRYTVAVTGTSTSGVTTYTWYPGGSAASEVLLALVWYGRTSWLQWPSLQRVLYALQSSQKSTRNTMQKTVTAI